MSRRKKLPEMSRRKKLPETTWEALPDHSTGDWHLEEAGTMTAAHPVIVGLDGEEVAEISAPLWTRPNGPQRARVTSEAKRAMADAAILVESLEMYSILLRIRANGGRVPDGAWDDIRLVLRDIETQIKVKLYMRKRE